MKESEVASLTSKASDQGNKSSVPALWMLLLLRLTTVASDDRLELRNSAIQTLLRIFDAYGDRLSPEAWSVCVESVVFKLLTALEAELEMAQDDKANNEEQGDWHGTAVVVLNGISNLVANYLEVLIKHDSFIEIWRGLLKHFTSLLDFGILEINTATFHALAHILSQTDPKGSPALNKEAIKPVWELWSRGIPVPLEETTGDNQPCLIAYIKALPEVYKLVEADLNVARVQAILTLLHESVEAASVSTYTTDIEQMTQLQSQVLDAIKLLRTNVEDVPSAIIKQIADLISLPFEERRVNNPKRTFVALSKASMQLAQETVLRHAEDEDIYNSGAFPASLEALCKPIALKYDFPIITRSTQPWRFATSTALQILGPALPQLEKLKVQKQNSQLIWSSIVDIADGILSADCDSAPDATPFADDEIFDIESFTTLRDLIIPALGAENVPDQARKAYAESLFRTSIIHEPSPSDSKLLSPTGLGSLYDPRPGRTVNIPPTKRSRIAYVALEHLLTLISTSPSELHRRIAVTAAPFLILRCGLTLRAYIADQPLRGKMPQPLSQKRELIWLLKKLVNLESESEAIPALEGVESEGRKHLLRLYPLVVKAVGVSKASDEVGMLLRKVLDTVGGEFGY